MTHHTPEHRELAELNIKGQGGSDRAKWLTKRITELDLQEKKGQQQQREKDVIEDTRQNLFSFLYFLLFLNSFHFFHHLLVYFLLSRPLGICEHKQDLLSRGHTPFQQH
jgi:hypothetical protein